MPRGRVPTLSLFDRTHIQTVPAAMSFVSGLNRKCYRRSRFTSIHSSRLCECLAQWSLEMTPFQVERDELERPSDREYSNIDMYPEKMQPRGAAGDRKGR